MPPSRPWILVTPASRGIGLALARHLLQTTKAPVVATARGDVDAARKDILKGFERDTEKRLKVLHMDVCDESSIAAAASTCSSHFPSKPQPKQHQATAPTMPWHLHLAFVVPGLLFPEKSPAQVDAADALRAFETNAVGPLLAMKHFSPFLPRKSVEFAAAAQGKREEDGQQGGGGGGGSSSSDAYAGLPPDTAFWATMSARVGSIADNRAGGWYSYRASKAAVNQLTKTFDNHLRASAGARAAAVALHPGTVRTGLSEEFWASVPEGKLFEKEYAAERLVEVVRGLDVEEGRGRCWDWKGEIVPP